MDCIELAFNMFQIRAFVNTEINIMFP